MLRQAVKDLGRLREIAAVAIRFGFGELVDRTQIGDVLGKRERGTEVPAGSVARRFRLMLAELGPTFIKLGQTLSSRPDLLPREYIEEFAQLQDNVSPVPVSHVLEQIRHSFGREPSELYAEFDETPLASASIAQVHRGRLHTGEEVAIKVQRPGIEAEISADLDLLRYAATLLEAVIEDTGIYTPAGIVEEFDQAIRAELDFLQEAQNLREFNARNESAGEIVIPRVFDAVTSRTVLTMEFIRGERIRTIDREKHDPVKLADRIIDCTFRQIFKTGLFHADPHPGNILVLDEDRIALLDFGAVGRLSRQMRENLVLLVVAVSLHDADTVARLLYRVAAPDRRADLAAFSADIRGALDRYMSATTTLGSVDAKQLIPELLDLAARYHIRIPKEYALLSRAGLSVEGLLRWLHPDVNVADAVAPYAKELLLGRLELDKLDNTAMRALLKFQTLTTDIPQQLSQILLDLESGKFRVNFSSEEIVRLDRSLRNLGIVVFFGFVACGLTIGAFLSLTRIDRLVFGVPALAIVAVVLLLGLFFVALGWSLAGAHMKRLSLARLLRRKR